MFIQELTGGGIEQMRRFLSVFLDLRHVNLFGEISQSQKIN
jgi:hypothetical protein